MREAGRADVEELTGLMRAFYAESGFVLDEQKAAAGFEALLGDARLGRVWLMSRVRVRPAAKSRRLLPTSPPPSTFVFAIEYAGLAAVVDDFYVRPEARARGSARPPAPRLDAPVRTSACAPCASRSALTTSSPKPCTAAPALRRCRITASWSRRWRRRRAPGRKSGGATPRHFGAARLSLECGPRSAFAAMASRGRPPCRCGSSRRSR